MQSGITWIIICNVKPGKEKKKNVYMYLRFYSHTPTVYTIFKISTMSYKILNQGWSIMSVMMCLKLSPHTLGFNFSQKGQRKQQQQQQQNGITGC